MRNPSPLQAVMAAQLRPLILAAFAISLASAPALSQRAPALDVPFVPTPPEVVEKMLELAQVSKDDHVIDLGSGDGRIAIAAAKRGATALGIDLNPVRVQEANENAKKEAVNGKVEFREQDLFKTDFSKANVLTMYLLSSVNIKLRPRILEELKPGTRVVSHAFDMDEWTPDEVANVNGRSVYYWVVPAKAEGSWQVKNGDKSFTLKLDQEFQKVNGTADFGGREVPVKDAKLRGDRLTFIVEDGAGQPQTFEGRVMTDRIEPVQSGANWQASRSST